MLHKVKLLALLVGFGLLVRGFLHLDQVFIFGGLGILLATTVFHIFHFRREEIERERKRFLHLETAILELKGPLIDTLRTCPDADLRARITELVIDAAFHLGSSPRTRGVFYNADVIIRWYWEGLEKAAEAKRLIDRYTTNRNSFDTTPGGLR